VTNSSEKGAITNALQAANMVLANQLKENVQVAVYQDTGVLRVLVSTLAHCVETWDVKKRPETVIIVRIEIWQEPSVTSVLMVIGVLIVRHIVIQTA
jgi:hypothetical protein